MVILNSFREQSINSSKYFDKCWYRGDTDSSPVDPSFVYTELVATAAGFLYCVESAIGAILNFLVILVLIKSKKLRKEYLSPSIVNIAWTDFLYSIFILPFNSLRFYMRDQPLPFGCRGFSFFAYGLWLCSAWNLLGIAILRCVRLYFPSRNKRELFRLASISTSVTSWVISFAFLLPTGMGRYGQFGFGCQTFGCYIIDINEDGSQTDIDPQTIYGVTVIFIGIGMVVFNIIIYLKLRKMARIIYEESKETDENKARTKRLEKEKLIGNVMGRITAIFILIYVFMITLRISIPKSDPNIALLCYLTAASIVVIDPLVHIISQQCYRSEILKLFAWLL